MVLLVNSLSVSMHQKNVYALYSYTQTMPNFSPKGKTKIRAHFQAKMAF